MQGVDERLKRLENSRPGGNQEEYKFLKVKYSELDKRLTSLETSAAERIIELESKVEKMVAKLEEKFAHLHKNVNVITQEQQKIVVNVGKFLPVVTELFDTLLCRTKVDG